MNVVIKERLEQIRRGDIPEGYKKSSVGLVPKEWEETTLGNIFDFKNGLNKEKEAFGFGTPIVNYVDVNNNRGLKNQDILGLVTVNSKELANYSVRKGDLFFTRTSETIDEIGLTSVILEEIKDAVFSGFVLRGRPKVVDSKIITEYNQYCYSSKLMRHEIIKKSSYTTRALTNGRLLSQVRINLPTLQEQLEIANILINWDNHIKLQRRKINKLESRRKSVCQTLLKPQKEWDKIKLRDVIVEKKKKNNCSISKVLSVSNKKGFILQSEQFSKEVASEDTSNYKIVEKNNIAYNPSRINVGSIALYDDEDAGIVSPMYVVFEVKKCDPKFLLYQLDTDYGKYLINSYLCGSVRDTLNYKNLSGIKMLMPSIEMQKQIANDIVLFDKQIKLEIKKLELLNQQKKSMMQLLLSGLVRCV